MATIQYKCKGCDQVRIGMKESVFVPGHIKTADVFGKIKYKCIDSYFICENCREYNKQYYLEVV